MISIFTQYSFGGYKIFNLDNGPVTEVTGDNRMGIPNSAIRLFSHYGIKLLYAQDIEGYYTLFINDIPCQEKDDMGRAKRCSLLLCGTSLSDARMLRKVVVMILFELDQFEQFISGLFAIKETLIFDSERFDKFFQETINDETINEDRLRHAMCKKGNPIVVYLTVSATTALESIYDNFGKKNLASSFLLKWDENSRSIKDRSVERIGFMRLIYKLISKLTTIWKN